MIKYLLILLCLVLVIISTTKGWMAFGFCVGIVLGYLLASLK